MRETIQKTCWLAAVLLPCLREFNQGLSPLQAREEKLEKAMSELALMAAQSCDYLYSIGAFDKAEHLEARDSQWRSNSVSPTIGHSCRVASAGYSL